MRRLLKSLGVFVSSNVWKPPNWTGTLLASNGHDIFGLPREASCSEPYYMPDLLKRLRPPIKPLSYTIITLYESSFVGLHACVYFLEYRVDLFVFVSLNLCAIAADHKPVLHNYTMRSKDYFGRKKCRYTHFLSSSSWPVKMFALMRFVT